VIEVGAKAPDFTLRDPDGEKVSLSDYAGTNLVLVFYPADFSNVCNDQLAIYQEVYSEIRSKGADLVAISVDGVFCHQAFRAKLGTEIKLLSDFHPKGDVARAYGAYIEERGHANRSLVLVDGNGIVSWVYESPPLEVPGANLIFDALSEI
jgi:peroxiredoxin